MITILIIGIIVFMVKMVSLAVKATWGLTKAAFAVLSFPIVLLILFLVGLVYISLPLLLVGLLVVFLKPIFKK